MTFPPTPDFPVKGEKLQNWLRTSFLPATVKDASGRQLLTDLRDMGAKIRTQTFFDIRREVLGIEKHQEAVTKVSTNAMVPEAFMITDHGLALSKNIQYRFEVTGISPLTGDELSWNYSLSASDPLIAGNAEDVIRSLIAGNEEFYGITLDEVTLVAVLADPDWIDDH